MKLSLGFSPCPNDTFIFDALVNQKLDTKSLKHVQLLDKSILFFNKSFSKYRNYFYDNLSKGICINLQSGQNAIG